LKRLYPVLLVLLNLVSACGRAATPPPDWRLLEGQGVTLWLPHNYGLFPARDDAPGAAESRIVFEASESYLLEGGGPLPAIVIVTRGHIPLLRSLRSYAEDYATTTSTCFSCSAPQRVDLGCRRVWRIVVDRPDASLTTAVYLQRRGAALWTVSFSASTAVFDRTLADSEQSMCTLRTAWFKR